MSLTQSENTIQSAENTLKVYSTWEQSGLLSLKRREKYFRFFAQFDMTKKFNL